MKILAISTAFLIALALVASSYINSVAFAAPNQGAPGQNFGGEHRNPSDGSPPPGQAHTPPVGNSGQCLKAGFDRGSCFPK